MLPDRVSNPGPLTYESGALPIALRGPARDKIVALIFCKVRYLPFPIYTHVISSSLTLGEVQHVIRLVYIKKKSIRGRGPI